MDNPSNEQNEQSDKMPEFFLEKKGKPEKKKSYKKLFGLKKNLPRQNWLKKMKPVLLMRILIATNCSVRELI